MLLKLLTTMFSLSCFFALPLMLDPLFLTASVLQHSLLGDSKWETAQLSGFGSKRIVPEHFENKNLQCFCPRVCKYMYSL